MNVLPKLSATPQQIEQAYLLHNEGARLNRVLKETGLDRPTFKVLARVFGEYEREKAAKEARRERYDRLISFQQSIRDIERGRSKGQVGASTSDRAPVPSGMALLPFIGILFEQHTFTSNTLPIGQQIEPERGR